MTALQCDRLVKRFGRNVALDGVSLTLAPGEFVALLGPNGAGKSTLLQILTGLFVADEGSVRVLGVDMRRSPTQALARIGVVFQQPALDLDLSVRANLQFHAALHGIGRAQADERARPMLARLGLEGKENALARSLSGGNRRKIELVRALLHRPAVLLMDEATVGLDPGSRTVLLDEVLRLTRDEGLAVLWATHLVPEAARATRIAVLSNGSVRFDGSAAALCAQQRTAELEQGFLSLVGVEGRRAGKEAA